MARRLVLISIVVVGTATLAALWAARAMRKELLLSACFDDVSGLQANASVRVAGVEVGTVSEVRARPDRKDCPAEAQFSISTPYELNIPEDAIARIESRGVLGPTIVNIDARQAYGPAIKSHGVLKTAPAVDAAKTLENVLRQTTKELEELRVKAPASPSK